MRPSTRWRYPLAMLAVLLLSGCGRSSPPDVLLILIDTLRADHVGAYGYPKPTTPVLDALANESLVFEQAIAQSSWTQPSVMSLFTSRYPREYSADRPFAILPEEATTLAEVLARAGYATISVSTNPHCDPGLGLMQGFERTRLELKAPAAWVVDAGLEELDGELQREKRRPIFLYLHFMDVHTPLEPPDAHAEVFLPPPAERGPIELASKYWLPPARRTDSAFSRRLKATSVALYDAALRYVDEEIGRLLAELERRGVGKDLLIAVVSDHGESHWEHEDFERALELRKADVTVGTGHGYALFPELLRVPMILRLPHQAPGRIRDRVRLIDLAPTVLASVGIDPDELGARGRDLRRWMSEGRAELPALSSTRGEEIPQLSYLRGPWQWMKVRDREFLFRWPRLGLPGPAATLSAEARELAAEAAELVESLPVREAEYFTVPPALVEMLKKLGYARSEHGAAPKEAD